MILETGAALALRVPVAIAIAVAAAVLGWFRLRSTSEPGDAPDAGDWTKPRYAQVADRWLLALAVAVAAPLAALAGATAQGAPTGVRLPVTAAWALTAGVGTVAILCDLRTTYLPSSLMRPWGALTVAALLAAIAVAVGADRSMGIHLVLRVAGCVVVARLVFWVWWRLGGGLGFGDVRLASILAADAAMVSIATWTTWLVAGTALGAVWGVTTTMARRRRPSGLGTAFPYGPALALGVWVALVLG